MNVLIVCRHDDNRMAQRVLVEMNFPDATLLEAGSYDEALKVLRAADIDVMITGFRLSATPESQNGDNLRIQATALNPQIKCILYSGAIEVTPVHMSSFDRYVDKCTTDSWTKLKSSILDLV